MNYLERLKDQKIIKGRSIIFHNMYYTMQNIIIPNNLYDDLNVLVNDIQIYFDNRKALDVTYNDNKYISTHIINMSDIVYNSNIYSALLKLSSSLPSNELNNLISNPSYYNQIDNQTSVQLYFERLLLSIMQIVSHCLINSNKPHYLLQSSYENMIIKTTLICTSKVFDTDNILSLIDIKLGIYNNDDIMENETLKLIKYNYTRQSMLINFYESVSNTLLTESIENYIKDFMED